MSSRESSRKADREQKASRMTARLGKLYDVMSFQRPFQNRGVLHLNTALLFHACISILIDLERHKEFHPLIEPAHYKKAAFVFKWLSRIQPVKPVTDYTKELSQEEVSANARFATIAALSYLQLDIETLIQSKDWKELIYSAMYRDIVPETWSLTFKLLSLVYATRKK